MLFVVLLHFNNHGVNIDLINFAGALTLQNGIGHLIESFAIVAVNCFVLISGYFGLSFKVKSILKLYLQCFFIGIFGYILYLLFTPNELELSKLLARVFAFTRNRYWFLYAYLFLYFISPLLNYAIEKMSRNEYKKMLALLSIFIFYFSYIRSVGDNTIGMSYVQFIFVYLIGRYIGIYIKQDVIKKYQFRWLLGYFITSVFVFVLAILEQKFHLQVVFLRPYPYNSILVVLGAIFLLLFMLSLDFRSKMINWVATSCFAVYLLQENPYFGFNVLYPHLGRYFSGIEGVVTKYVMLFLISVCFFVLGVLVDKFFALFTALLLKFYDKKIVPTIKQKFRLDKV